MAIKAITFDLDNTLWDVEPTLIKAEKAQNSWLAQHRPLLIHQFSPAQIREHRLEFCKKNKHLAHQISQLRIQSTRYLLQRCGYSAAEATTGAEAAFKTFLSLRHQVEPYPEAFAVLEKLAKSYTLGALTNGNADIFKVDIGCHFDFAFTAEQVNASKPKPELFFAALKKTGLNASEVIHVGDSPAHDVGGARQAGLYSIWMNPKAAPWPGDIPADAEIRQLTELPKAIAVIASAQPLLPRSLSRSG